jgi:hypothetical protein
LVLIIDDPDRCKPDFSIKLMETIKHFFDIDGLFVILLLNYTSFTQSLKGLYGTTFDDNDGEHYIDKFVDVRIPMYVPSEDEYKSLIRDFMGEIPEKLKIYGIRSEELHCMAAAFLDRKLTLRQLQKACEEISGFLNQRDTSLP